MNRLLIEQGLPFAEINEASRLEKGAGPLGHPFRMHRWWARRPLAMCRAIVFGSLVSQIDDPKALREAFGALRLASLFKDAAKPERVDPLRRLVRESFDGRKPRVLDCFAGGGMIPLEAARLGCEVTAVDLNPVAHLLELAVLDFPQRFGSELADDLRHWARWVESDARCSTSDLFPNEHGKRDTVYFWARTMPCSKPGCRLEIPLVVSWWLARGRRRVRMEPLVKGGTLEIGINSDVGHDASTANDGTIKTSSVTCPLCHTTTPATEVRLWAKANTFGLRLLAALEESSDGRRYRLPTDADHEAVARASDAVASLESEDEDGSFLPVEMIDPDQSRTMRMLVYGIRRYRDLFTPRQLFVAHALCSAVRRSHDEMRQSGMGAERVAAITVYLGMMVSRLVGFNSSFATWENEGEKVRNTYSLQAIKMAWDFTEINPFLGGSGSWEGGLEPVAQAIEHCAMTSRQPVTVLRGNAQSLDAFEDDTFDAVITDPPYYDAVQYGDLSDFFYVWLKRAIGFTHPTLFATPLTPKAHEVIENRADKKSDAYISSEEFERRLARSIAEMRRVVKPDGVVVIVFAHTEADAWERLLRSLLSSGLVVSTSWPMKSEMGNRSTANVSAVLGSSVVLVCRPREIGSVAFYDDVVHELDARIGERLDEFELLGLEGADFLISAIGPAFEVFGRYSSVQRLNGEEVSVSELLALARRTVARHAMRRLLGSEALAAVDDVSLFYLTWRWAYGSARIPVDEAQKLGKAFNVEANELNGVDGLVETARDAYALRGPDDRKRIKLGVSPSLVDVLHVACKLFEQGRRTELAEVLAGSGFAEEPAFWAAARAIAESLPDGDRERILLVNLLGGQSQTVEAARQASPNEVLRLFEVET